MGCTIKHCLLFVKRRLLTFYRRCFILFAMNTIDRACEVLGSQRALADLLRVRPATVSQWRNGIRPIPIERCTEIEMVTGGAVTRRDLRPDDWQRIWPELAEQAA